MRRVLVTLAAVALAAACSGSSDDSARPAPTSAPVPTSEATTTSAPPESTTTTAAAGPQPCRTADLQIAVVDGRAALGHALAIFEIRNRSSLPCRLTGYPGVELRDASGRVLAQARRERGYILNDRPPAPVTIAPGGVAYFGVESLSACAEGDPQEESDRIVVIPPDETAPIEVAANIAVCPEPPVVVSPVRRSAAELATF